MLEKVAIRGAPRAKINGYGLAVRLEQLKLQLQIMLQISTMLYSWVWRHSQNQR
ncbi:MAG: hypothetical protein Ct9H90mP13_04860 [Pseudomonadota bacterium]|nr:MAG: hypothetical protein Ct9H90mP13_04860 [Pseudomonadota bacterium]